MVKKSIKKARSANKKHNYTVLNNYGLDDLSEDVAVDAEVYVSPTKTRLKIAEKSGPRINRMAAGWTNNNPDDTDDVGTNRSSQRDFVADSPVAVEYLS